MTSLFADAALRVGLFDAIRSVYHFVGNRSYRRLLLERERLYRQFITPGSLVMDIGANHGEYALTYRHLGARVICVEPNPALAEKLRRRFGTKLVVEAAVSQHHGSATLHLGLDSNHSTIVDSWLPTSGKENRFSNSLVTVRVTTLDSLMSEYGIPAFIKIDVEANELQVLRGLSTPVRALVFEYQCLLIDQLSPALDHLDGLGSYEYGLCVNDSVNWMTRVELEGVIADVCATGDHSGDVFARLKA